MQALQRVAPGLRCELVEAEPEQSLPALSLGDVDVVLADEWLHQPHPRPLGIGREELHRDPVRLVLATGHPAALRHLHAVPVAELAGDSWTCGHARTGWEEMTQRTCREFGRFDPDIRHRTNDSVTGLAVVASGQAVTLLPQLVVPVADPRLAVRAIAGGSVYRTIYIATRTADVGRPSVRAILDAVREAAAQLERPVP
jgi:DNA-binding transcriptional LysR family regulator